MLPIGVVPVQPHGTRNSIFWMHYLSVNLAHALGDDQPFLSIKLSAQDIASLGNGPTLQSIAAKLVGKIFAIQPQGPFTIGGLCLGGILAYETASQIQAIGIN